MTAHPRILIIGVGSIGERHLRCFQSTNRCDLAFCETLAERRESVAGRYGVAGYAGVEEAMNAESFTAAVIAAPASYHVDLARQLVAAGLHLLIEKPVSTTLAGVEELTSLVEAKQAHVTVGYMMRGLPSLKEMKAAIDSGRYGRAVELVVAAGQNFPFYRPAYREIYYAKRELGGGAIQDGITHHLNASEWLIGPITRLVADAEHCVLEGVEVEDTVHVLTRHGSVLGSFSFNQYQPPNEFRITVNCERGSFRWEMQGQRWYSASEPGGDWKLEAEHQVDRDGFYISQANQFLDQLEGNAAPLCSLADGVQTLKVNLAALESVETGKWVKVK